MPGAGVVVALPAEARAFGETRAVGIRRALAGDPVPLADGGLLVLAGMGPAAAERAAGRLAAAGVAGLVSFGLAGGLDPALQAGDVVLPGEVIDTAGTRWPTDTAWRAAFAATLTGRQRIEAGALLASSRPLDSAADKHTARQASGAVAVDMESGAIGLVAMRRRLPFLVVRVVVDTAQDALPAAVAAASREGRLRLGRLLLGIAAAPQDILGLIRLGNRFRAARSTLAALARVGFGEPGSAPWPPAEAA